jgi:hypothetical protein
MAEAMRQRMKSGGEAIDDQPVAVEAEACAESETVD